MRAFPADIDPAVEHCATVVVRTDFSDGAGRLATLAALEQRPEDWDDYEADTVVIDDPAWAGATPEEVREAVRRDGYLTGHVDVVVIADRRSASTSVFRPWTSRSSPRPRPPRGPRGGGCAGPGPGDPSPARDT